MTLRLIDLICDGCRDAILDARVWLPPSRCTECALLAERHHGESGPNLPHLDGREAAAIHEAGHVVVGLACDYTIHYATLGPSGRAGSSAHYQAQIFDYQVGSSGHVVMALAGSAAGRRWVLAQGCASDADMLEVVNTGLTDVGDMFERGWVFEDVASRVPDADAVVDLHWHAIERVAAALLDHGRLTGDEIAQIAGLECGATA